MRRVLMVAYHFPPLAGSSGIQRTLRFVQNLPRFGWEPLVLTTHPFAYERTSSDLDRDVPPQTVVRRAFALDTARHLAVRGRYIGWMARPDRWASWKFDAVREGAALIRRFRPQAIWSTYPIATAHVIAATLTRQSHLPWIADFRDPMAQQNYPADPRTRASYQHIERLAMDFSSRALFTTPSAAQDYRERYPDRQCEIDVLENGYDEESYLDAEKSLGELRPLTPNCITLLHSGIVYPSERDPTCLFEALRELASKGEISPSTFRIRFRAPVHDEFLRRLASQYGMDSFIEIEPPIGYRDALSEMLRADALLVLQADNCNQQVPAKVYEYLRASRPILCLADPGGDTASVIRKAGIQSIAALESSKKIADLLPSFLQSVRSGEASLPYPHEVANASRVGRTASLSAHLDALVR